MDGELARPLRCPGGGCARRDLGLIDRRNTIGSTNDEPSTELSLSGEGRDAAAEFTGAVAWLSAAVVWGDSVRLPAHRQAHYQRHGGQMNQNFTDVKSAVDDNTVQTTANKLPHVLCAVTQWRT